MTKMHKQNKKYSYSLSVLSLLCGILFISCASSTPNIVNLEMNGDKLEVSLHALSDSTHTLEMRVNGKPHSSWPLKYPVYQFTYGDITGDGIPEVAVGVIKPTRFDPHPNKRLFLFRITDDYYIRPLWLGSRVSQPLEDFTISCENDSVFIRTMEKEQSGKFLIARYYWKGFGITFNDYVKREITASKAQRLLVNR